MMFDRGNEIHGEVDSSTASGGVAFTLWESGAPVATTRTLESDEWLVITDLTVIAAAGGLVKVVADSDAAGRLVFKGTLDVYGGVSMRLATPYVCPKGVVPKLIAPTGAVTAVIQGHITKG